MVRIEHSRPPGMSRFILQSLIGLRWEIAEAAAAASAESRFVSVLIARLKFPSLRFSSHLVKFILHHRVKRSTIFDRYIQFWLVFYRNNIYL